MNDQLLSPGEYRYYSRIVGAGLSVIGIPAAVIDDLPSAGAGVVLGAIFVVWSMRR